MKPDIQSQSLVKNQSKVQQITQYADQYIQNYLDSESLSYKPKKFIRNPLFADSTTYKIPKSLSNLQSPEAIPFRDNRTVTVNGRYCNSFDAQINKRSWVPIPGNGYSEIKYPDIKSLTAQKKTTAQKPISEGDKSQQILSIYNYNDNITEKSPIQPSQKLEKQIQTELFQIEEKNKKSTAIQVPSIESASLNTNQEAKLFINTDVKPKYVRHNNIFSDRYQQEYKPKFDVGVKWDRYQRPQFRDFALQTLSYKDIVKQKNQIQENPNYMTTNKIYGTGVIQQNFIKLDSISEK